MMPIMNNKKLSLVPAVLLSSVLLLTACSTGSPATNNNANPPASPSASASANSPAPSSASSPAPSVAPTVIQGYVAAPTDMTKQFKAFYGAPPTLNDQNWAVYKNAGATTYKEDPAERSTTSSEWAASRADARKKLVGEMMSDVDQSATNVSAVLASNPSSTLDSIKADKSLIINRFPNVGTTDVYQDSSTGFYFVVFSPKENIMPNHGILVPQKGKTPDFNHETPPPGL
jgi:hypothetical protein